MNRECLKCHESSDENKIRENLYICPHCGNYFRIHPYERIAMVADKGSFQEMDAEVESLNPIQDLNYEEKLVRARKKSKLKNAMVSGKCTIHGNAAMLGVMSFDFMGGSMGSVVGEKVVRLFRAAIEHRCPAFLFSASGGARMQEGIFSLMQMGKTANAVIHLQEAGIPYFVILTDPTTGGVTASFAMLGDVILAEPGSLIGFAGQRVARDTVNQHFPKNFQRAEFQLEKGFVDAIVERKDLKSKLAFLIRTHRIAEAVNG